VTPATSLWQGAAFLTGDTKNAEYRVNSEIFPEALRLLPPKLRHGASSGYGTAQKRRSVSVPTSGSPRSGGDTQQQPMEQKPTGRNAERPVQRAAAHAYARSTFFHGSFTSSHGLTVTRATPRTPALLPAKHRASPQLGPAKRGSPQMGAMAAERPPPLLIPPPSWKEEQRRPLGHRRSLSASDMDAAIERGDGRRHSDGDDPRRLHETSDAGDSKSPVTAPSAIAAVHTFPAEPFSVNSAPTVGNRSFGFDASGGTPPDLRAEATMAYANDADATQHMTPHMLPPPAVPSGMEPLSLPSAALGGMQDPYETDRKMPHSPCVEFSASSSNLPSFSTAHTVKRRTAEIAVMADGAVAVSVVPHSSEASQASSVDDADDVVTWVDAVLEIVPLALPSVVSMLLTYALTAVPLAFIGTYHGGEALSGASVGYFILSIVGQYPITGLTFALDALCSMEYGRDPKSTAQGILLQRAIIVNAVFLIPVCILLFSVEGLLSSIYDPSVVSYAVKFLRFAPLFLCPLAGFTAFSKFCANQLLPQMPMIAMLVGVASTPIVQRWLAPMGVEGAMIGMAMTIWIELAVLVTLTLSHKQTRGTFGTLRLAEAAAIADVKDYLRIALPSALFVAAEASAFDMSVLLAAKIGDPEGAAWSAILNSLLFFVSPAGGLSAAAAAKVGASLGAGYPNDARRYAFAAVGVATFVCLVNSVVIYSSFDVLLSLFGTSGLSLRAGLAVRWLAPLMHIADSIQFCFQGVFSGAGQNHKGAMILLSCLWAFGFPLSLILAFFHGFGLEGVVGGLTIGLFVEIPLMTYYVHTMDWRALAEEAMQDEDVGGEEEDEQEEEEEHEMQQTPANA
jgi:Na+-driven multidrug efflux pump